MLELLMAAALTAATLGGAHPAPVSGATPQADPAMFVVRDSDTTVYIFGTFHALDGKTEWFKDRVRSAFESSNELVLETLVPEGPVKPETPVMSRASVQLRNLSMAPSASFLATTRMAINAGRSQGMQVGNGADMVLRHVAEDEGKTVEGLETLQLQIDMFNKMPAPAVPAPKKGAAASSSADLRELSNTMAEMQEAWRRGDQSVFVQMLDQLNQASPATYRMMFTERNARWADWIRARMQTPGVVFVAVGAGHLAGKDSLLVRLAELGIVSQRVY
jgi:uncharacterized protein YbaP (TraB family)